MDFLTHASRETSALVERLLATQSGLQLRQIESLRQALDAAARALETPVDPRGDVDALAIRLAEAADAEVRRVRDDAERDAERTRERLDGMAVECARLTAAVAAAEAGRGLVEEELNAVRARAAGLESELASTLAEFDEERERVANELEGERAAAWGAREALDRLAAEHAALASRHEQAIHERDRLIEAHGGLETALGLAEAQIRELTAALAAAQEARERAEREVDLHTLAQRDTEATLADASVRVRALEERLAGRNAEIRDLRELAARAAEGPAPPISTPAGGALEPSRFDVDRMLSLLDASVRAVAELGNTGSSTDLLAEAVKRLSLQFARVAWFRLHGERLQGEYQIGFEEVDDFAAVRPPVTDSLPGLAASSGHVQTAAGASAADAAGLPYGGSPTLAVALPVLLNGTVLGVLYADDADLPEAARGPFVRESSLAFARLIVGQVMLLLARHAHELRALADLRHYTATLLDEVRGMYLADAASGRAAEQLRARLRENLECASQLYTYRAAVEGTASAPLFDEEVAAEMREATPFARELSIVVREMAENVEVMSEDH